MLSVLPFSYFACLD